MSDKSIEVYTFPEEWDTLLKIMPNEVNKSVWR